VAVAVGVIWPGGVRVAVGIAVAVGEAGGLLITDICSVPQAMIKQAVIMMKTGLMHLIDKE
jgi:hypothetical protein